MSTSTHTSPVELSNKPTMEQPTGLDEQLQKLELKEMTSDVPSHEPEHDEKQHETGLPEDQDDAAEPAAEDEQADPQPAEEESPAVVEKKEEKPKAPDMQLRSTRKFKSVGNPTFGGPVGAAAPRQPSRFVTVGNPEYKTIKASITSIADIYKAAGMTAPEEKQQGEGDLEDVKEAMHETILEEDLTSPSAASYRFSERDDAEEHGDGASTHYEDATTALGSDDEEGGVVADKLPPTSMTPKEDDSHSSEAVPPYDPFSDDAQVVDHKPAVYGDEKKPVWRDAGMELQGILGGGEDDARRFGVNDRKEEDEDGLESPEEVVRGYISLAEGMRRVGDLNGAVASYLEALELLIDSQDNRTEVAEDVSDSDTAREDDLDVVALMVKMDDFCREIAAPVLREIYVPHHLAPQTLNAIRQLASALYHNRRDIFGKGDPDTLGSLRLLMMMLFVIGRWTDAIDHGREYLRLTSMISEHTDVHERMEVKRVLGLMLRELDATEQKEAQIHLDEVYRFRKDELGPTHEKTIRSLFDLSTVNESLDNLEDMVAMFEVVVDECIAELGEGHPRTLLCLSHLILLFDKVGREDDASDMQATLNQRLEEAREKRHGDLFLAMANQALFLVELEELDEAETVYQRLTNLYSTSLSESHPDRIRIMEQYAQFMQSIGEVPSATEVRGRVVETLKKTLGPQHPQTLRSTFDLASCLGASGQFPQARALLEEVVIGYQEMLGAECGKVIETLQAAGVVLVQLGELVQAREVHEQIVEKLTAKYGESDEKTIAAFVSLAGVIWSSGMETEGLAMEVKAIELQKSVLGPKHPTTLQTIHNHAVTLQSIGRYSTSLALLKEVHAARKDVLGDAHTHTIASLYSIAVSFEGLGQNQEAVKTVEEVVELAERSCENGDLEEMEVEEYRDSLTEMRKELDLFEKKFGAFKTS
ncbi:TPR-like protein [Serendipita vermifera]|nr:TPR-like protein [Serendipita vermifera]